MTRLTSENLCYGSAINIVDNSPSVNSKQFRSWASSISTDLSVHAKDFFKGLLLTRIWFLGASLENGLETIISTALMIKELAIFILMYSSSSIAYLTQLKLRKSFEMIVGLKHVLAGEVPDHKENFDSIKRGLFRTVNSVIGIAVPILAYWINQAIEGN